jgi:hypothetical protein
MLEFLAVNRGRRLPVKAVVTAALVEIRNCAITEASGTDTDQSMGIEMQFRVLVLEMKDIIAETRKDTTTIWRFTWVPIRLSMCGRRCGCGCGLRRWVGRGQGVYYYICNKWLIKMN